jgi:hypothetical protein
MTMLGSWRRGVCWPVVTVLAATFICGGAVSAYGQYYYQPSPDYYRNDTAEGTIFGGVLGAVTGAVIGGKKDRGEGALIGAGVGAVTGNLLGRKKDQTDERRAAAGATAAAHANQQAAARAVTNIDLIRMAQAGVSDDLIISTIRARGTRLDLSPQALISLKESGVSDPVMIAAQEMTRGPVLAPAPAMTTVITEPAPRTVIIAPPPRRVYHYVPYHHRRGPRRPHYGFNFRF